MTRHRTARRPRGAITLLVAIGLVTLAGLTSLFSARSVLVDQLASRNHAYAVQARLAADAALAAAQAMIAGSGNPVEAFFTTPSACPAGVAGAQWQCSDLPVSTHPAMPQAHLSATIARDLVRSPHVVRVYAGASISAHQSRAQVQESLFVPVMPPAPGLAAPAALVLNGCLSEAMGANLRVCPLTRQGDVCNGTAIAPAVLTHHAVDTNLDGRVSPAESMDCLALKPASLSASGDLIGPGTPAARSPCTRAAWRSVLGDISDEQLKAWSEAQERNGLTAQSTPPRTVYWSDSPNAWEQSIGTAQNPALLVFSALACALRCPHVGANVKIFGSVLIASSCNDEKMRGWQAGLIEGQLVVESGLPEWRLGTVYARPEGRNAYILDWPEGISASQVQRVNGSRSEGASP